MEPAGARTPQASEQTPQSASRIATVTRATKTYGATAALRDVSFSLRPGEVRALLGKNGAGKSTLIRLLSGAETPDAGEVRLVGEPLGTGGVRRSNRLGVQTVYQELSLVPEMSVAENLFLGNWPSGLGGIQRTVMQSQAREALATAGLSGLDPRQTVASLSIATRQLVEIARALMHRPRLLILDEPTSSLATAEVAVVLDVVKRLAREGVAVVYVSHRMAEIRQICETATVMRDGEVIETFTVGEYSTAEIVHLMLGEVTEELNATGRFRQDTDVVLSVRGLDVPPKLAGIDLDLHRGEILGVSGVLGSGRSELLRAIAGVDKITAGTITAFGAEVRRPTRARMQRLGIGFTPEGRKDEGIVSPLSVAENIVFTRWKAVSGAFGLSRTSVNASAQDVIDKLSIKTHSPTTPIENLSGGNQQKAVIGRWLHAGSAIMLFDEPTRGVDVEAKAQIYDLVRALADDGTSIIFVSSEVEELVAVCDRVLVLRKGKIAQEFRAPGIDLSELLTASIAEH